MDYKELIELSQKAADEWRNDHAFYQAGILIDSLCSAIKKLLAEQNANNVTTVVHGRWMPPVVWKYGCLCSVCKKQSDNGYDYCPNCGAKMDLD